MSCGDSFFPSQKFYVRGKGLCRFPNSKTPQPSELLLDDESLSHSSHDPWDTTQNVDEADPIDGFMAGFEEEEKPESGKKKRGNSWGLRR